MPGKSPITLFYPFKSWAKAKLGLQPSLGDFRAGEARFGVPVPSLLAGRLCRAWIAFAWVFSWLTSKELNLLVPQ